MGEKINIIIKPNLRMLVKAANEENIKKDEIISINETKEGYILFYYR